MTKITRRPDGTLWSYCIPPVRLVGHAFPLTRSGSGASVDISDGYLARLCITPADSNVLGIPKPIVMNHATYAVVDNDRNLATVPGRRNQNFSLWNFGDDGGFSFSSFPPFHVGFSFLSSDPVLES